MKYFFRNHFRFMLLFWFNLCTIAAFAVMRIFRMVSVLNYPTLYFEKPLFHAALFLIMFIPVAACLLGTFFSDRETSPEKSKRISTFFGIIVALGMVIGTFANFVESLSVPMRSETQNEAFYAEFDETVNKCWVEPICSVFPETIPKDAKDIHYHYVFQNSFSVELSYTLAETSYTERAERLRSEFGMQGNELFLSDTIRIEDSGLLKYDLRVILSDDSSCISYFVQGASADEFE